MTTRHTNTLARKPAIDLDDDDTDDGKPAQRTVAAANAAPVATTAPASVFGIAGAAAKPKRRSPTPLPSFDPTAITIRSGVPLPPPAGRGGSSPYHALIERMQVGDSVELDARRAKSLMAAAKKIKTVKMVIRMQGCDRAAVWRTA